MDFRVFENICPTFGDLCYFLSINQILVVSIKCKKVMTNDESSKQRQQIAKSFHFFIV